MLGKVELIELFKKNDDLPELHDDYSTASYYDASINQETDVWHVDFILRPYPEAMEKTYTGKLFEKHVEHSRVFTAVIGEEEIGWIELGYESWNNRIRIWEFLVKKEFRRQGIGRLLMNKAVELTKEKSARMLVLETQSNNTSAIAFYMKQGFRLIGFDSAAYSNDDIGKKEVRLELGLIP